VSGTRGAAGAPRVPGDAAGEAPPDGSSRPSPSARAAVRGIRARRLRAPLLVMLGALLAIEAAGGILIFFARLAFGSLPGLALHVVAGVALTFVYAAYQWRHAMRVLPVRPRLDYVLGLLAAAFVVLTLGSGLALALPWWRSRGLRALPAYPTRVMALHIIGCMLVLTFVAAHLGAVLKRDRSEG